MIETLDPHPRVVAALTAAHVKYVVRRHADCPFPIQNPKDFARALDRPVESILKALFLEMADPEEPARYALAVCPIPVRVDFAALARHWRVKRVRLAGPAELAATLEYPPNGVSPLGGKDLPVVMEDSAFAHPTVLAGAGVEGVEIELSPEDLQKACAAERLAFAATG